MRPKNMTSLLIRNARIVDGSQDRPTDPMQIAIEDGTIKEVAASVSFLSLRARSTTETWSSTKTSTPPAIS